MKCPDCKGKGFYEGFTEREKCRTCNGSGSTLIDVATPGQTERYVWANTYREQAPNVDQFVAAAIPRIEIIANALERRLDELDARIANIDSKPDWLDESELECEITTFNFTSSHLRATFNCSNMHLRFEPLGLLFHNIPDDIHILFGVQHRSYYLVRSRNVRPYCGKWPGKFTVEPEQQLRAGGPGYVFEFYTSGIITAPKVTIELWGKPHDNFDDTFPYGRIR